MSPRRMSTTKDDITSMHATATNESPRQGTYLNIPQQEDFDDNYAKTLIRLLRQMPPVITATKPTAPQTFPFLKLPPELRNNVYEVVLQRSCVQRLQNFTTPALSRTCAQLRHETLPVFFQLNTFVAEIRATCGACAYQYIDLGDKTYADHHLVSPDDIARLGTVIIDASINPLSWECYAKKAFFKNVDIVLLRPDPTPNGTFMHESVVISLRFDMPHADDRPHRMFIYEGTRLDRHYDERHALWSRPIFQRHCSIGLGWMVINGELALWYRTHGKQRGLSLKDLQICARAFKLESSAGNLPKTKKEVFSRRVGNV